MNWSQPSFPVLLCGCGGKGTDEIRNKVEPGKKMGGSKAVLRFDFIYHYCTLTELVWNWIIFPKSVLSMMLAGKWSLPELISTHELYFPLSKDGMIRAPLVGTWCAARVKPPHLQTNSPVGNTTERKLGNLAELLCSLLCGIQMSMILENVMFWKDYCTYLKVFLFESNSPIEY